VDSRIPINGHPLAASDPAVRPGWNLLEFLSSIGADEFAVRFMYAGDDGEGTCERLARMLAFASLGERIRECSVTYAHERNPRPVEVWRLDLAGVSALREVMPDGILGSTARVDAWAEDLCVYRRGELLLGTISHERLAFLRISDEEWGRWQAWAAQRRTS
jgi:hypothetical protein